MFVKDLKELINPVCNTAIQAGKLIKKFYKSNNNILLKDDKSPITKADIESNLLIKKSLIINLEDILRTPLLSFPLFFFNAIFWHKTTMIIFFIRIFQALKLSETELEETGRLSRLSTISDGEKG